jgi:hypothetical protein
MEFKPCTARVYIQDHRRKNILKKEEKRMKKNSEKPSTLTAALYIIGLIICGYFIVKAIVTF